MTESQGGFGGLKPLSPDEFRSQLANTRSAANRPGADEAAYEEFLSNCRALSLKANTALLQQADTIRHGDVVDLRRTYVGGAGLQAMCTLLARNDALKQLLMPQNGLYNDAVVYFCRSMKGHRKLSAIDFSGNAQLSLAGGLALLSLVNENRPVLTQVNITGTRIPDAVATKIDRALAANQEAFLFMSSDAVSLEPSPAPPAVLAPAAMAKTMGALDNTPQHLAAHEAASSGSAAKAASGLFRTYAADGDAAKHKRIFVLDRTAGGSATYTSTTRTTEMTTTTTTSAARDRSDTSAGQSGSHVNQHTSASDRLGGGATSLTEHTTRSANEPAAARNRDVAHATAWATKEEKTLKQLYTQLSEYATVLRENNATNMLPPADPTTRWRVLEVAILAPPAIFDSEIDILLNDVFPTLNRELQSRRVTLQPLVNPSSSSGTETKPTVTVSNVISGATVGAAGQALKSIQCVTAVDVLQDVQRSRLAVIELIGDRPGDVRQPTEADMEAGALEMVPVLYKAHQEALACCQCIIAAIRMSASCMNIPPSLAPLFTCEPRIEHPDKHRPVEKAVRMVSDLLDPAASTATSTTTTTTTMTTTTHTIVLDHQNEQQLWERHQAFKNYVRRSLSASPEMLIDGYKATFDRADSTGAVHVTQLEAFRNAIFHRLSIILITLFSPVTTKDLLSVADLGVGDENVLRGAGETGRPAKDIALPECDLFMGPAAHQRHLARRAYQTVSDRQLCHIIEASPRTLPRKGVQNRLHLYVTTPPSRNMFLLHHPQETTTLTATLAITAAKQLFAKPFAYTVAFHSTRAGVLSEEPTDVRDVMVHTLSQLTTHPDVLHYLRCEVDVHRLKRFFINFLSGSQIRAVESQPAMVALAGLGAGATPMTHKTTSSEGKDSGESVATMNPAASLLVPIPDITAKTLQQRAKESAERDPLAAEDASRIFVVLMDGLDAVVAPVEPCSALCRSPETGADEWWSGETVAAAGAARGESASGARDAGEGADTKFASPSRFTDANSTRIAASGKVKQAHLVAEETQRLSFLPTCLCRNVRLIATCTTDPAPHLLKVLAARGRDSVDTFALANTTVNETEMLLSPSALDPLGVALSDDGLVLARDMPDSQNPEFLHYLTDALRMHFDAPGTQSLLQLLKAFPGTVDEAARRVYQQLVVRFGQPLVKNALGLLSVSRWGIVEADLRSLLQLPPKRFNEFLRLLRPALESLEWFGVPPIPSVVKPARAGDASPAPEDADDEDDAKLTRSGRAPESPGDGEESEGRVVVGGGESGEAGSSVLYQTRLDPNCSGNALQRRVRLVSPAFLRLLRQEELRADEEGVASAAERRTWHQTLAQHYYGIIQRSLSQERHQLVLSATPMSGSERYAVKEFVYHVTLGSLWALLDRVALTFPFLMLVYRHQLAYAYLRDLIFAFNTRHEEFLLGQDGAGTVGVFKASARGGEDGLQGPFDKEGDDIFAASASMAPASVSGAVPESTLPTALLRMRSYIFFVRQYSALLTEHPQLVLQAALERSAGLTPGAADVMAAAQGSGSSTLRMVQYEAAEYVRRYFYWQPTTAKVPTVAPTTAIAAAAAVGAGGAAASDAHVRLQNRKRVFFRIVNERKCRVHLGPVTTCHFSPNGKYVLSGSSDRSVAWVQPGTGSTLYHGRQSSSRIRKVIFADTSAYALSIAEDRTLYVYDAALGKLVSRNDGALFNAPISSVEFSSRGRYYLVGLEDFNVHVFSTEKSQLVGSVPALSWAATPAAANGAGDSATAGALTHRRAHVHVLPDSTDEKRFHIFANERVQTWSVNALGDGLQCDVSPHTTALNSPLASVRWYPLAAVQRHRERQEQELRESHHAHRREALKDLAAPGRYALLLPQHRQFVSLYDMESQCETARVRPASLEGQCWRPSVSAGTESADDAKVAPTVVCYAVSESRGNWLAVGASDGSVTLYDLLQCIAQVRVSRQLAVATINAAHPIEAPVHTPMIAYRASAESPRIVGLAFALDDTALLAVSDTNRVLYWDVANLAAQKEAQTATTTEADGTVTTRQQDDIWCVPLLDVSATGHRRAPYEGADGEFLLSSLSRGHVVSWAVRPDLPSTPPGANGAANTVAPQVDQGASLVAIGDSDGRVVLLDVWRPTA